MPSFAPRLFLLLATLAAPLEAQTGRPGLPGTSPSSGAGARGLWEAPVNHDDMPMAHFNAIHAALIPEGPQRGQVLTWNSVHGTGGSMAMQDWAVLDFSVPGAPVFRNDTMVMPTNEGDLFCAGFAWTPDGKLFVAGGTSQYNDPLTGLPYMGGRLAYLYDPSDFSGSPLGTWNRQADLEKTRWYPTVTLLPDDTLLVLGGTSNTDYPDRNDYEAFHLDPFNPVHGSWQKSGSNHQVFAGPNPGPLAQYPRCHVMPDGKLFLSGMSGWSATLDHAAAPGLWQNTPRSSFDVRIYGSSVLFPLIPGGPAKVGILGGRGDIGGVNLGWRKEVEYCEPATGGWTAGPALAQGRMYLNSLLLPDGTVLVTGGQEQQAGTLVPELLEKGAWKKMAQMDSLRDYHATSVLLPDGRVLTTGGNERAWDYQVWVPPYLCRNLERPEILGVPAQAGYQADGAPNLVVDHKLMSSGVVDRAVLVRPSAVTHHFNTDQRVVELETAAQGGASIEVRPPQNSAEAPRGWYMLFLISDAGTPSEAGWVRLQ